VSAGLCSVENSVAVISKSFSLKLVLNMLARHGQW